MEKVYVGKDREFKKVQEVLLLKGKENLEIFIEEGEYEDMINLTNANNMRIIGLGKVLLLNNPANDAIVFIGNSNYIFLENLILQKNQNSVKQSVQGVQIEKGNSNITICRSIINKFYIGINSFYGCENLLIENSFLINNIKGINIEYIYNLPNTNIKITKTSFIKNQAGLVLIKKYSNPINVDIIIIYESCVFCLNSISIDCNLNDIRDIKQVFNQIIHFSNKKYTELDIKAFFTNPLELEDPESNDFRFKDKRFKDFGVSEDLLLKYVGKNFVANPSQKLLKNYAKLGVFLNMSMEKGISKFEQVIKESDVENNEFVLIKSVVEVENIDSLLIINNAFDEAENPQTIFELIAQCQELAIPFSIFIPSYEYKIPQIEVNATKISSILATVNQLIEHYQYAISYYNDLDNLKQLLYEKLYIHVPTILVQKVRLENIGHFNAIDIDLAGKITCFIGLNGTGKTTILRGIALALIGHQHKGILKNNLDKLLKIQGIENGFIQREKGKIALDFEINQNPLQSFVKFEVENGNGSEVISENIQTLNGEIVKCLIIGFTQSRGTAKLGEQSKQRNAVQLPEISDLIPLINNEGDNRLQLFSSWIINLDAEANKKELNALKEGKEGFISQERQIIEKVFDIFSKITHENVKFKEVLNNNDVWIITKTNPLGISIDLVSQGFQSVIGWIGYLLQRMAEAYSDSKDFTKEPAICFVDEIDTYLHPKWQRNILKVLKEEFTKTQFIITTHSPLVISNLKNDEVNIFKVNRNSVEKIPAYGKNLHSIYYEAFGIPERTEEVQKLFDTLSIAIENEDIEKAESLFNTLKSMIWGNDAELLGYETSIDLLKNEHEIYQEESE